MMKRCFLLAAMLFMLAAAHAQVFTASFGPSFPTGDFASDKVKSNSSGLAKMGMMLELGYTHRIKKSFSVAAMVHAQQNALNTAALEDTYGNTPLYNYAIVWNGTTPPPFPQGPVYKNWKFEKHYWRTASLLLGGQAQLQLGAKGLYLNGRVMLGPTYASAPKVEGKSVSDTATATVSQTGAHAWGLGYLLGAGLSYDLSAKIFLTGRLDVFGTNKMTFKDITATVTTTKGNSPANMQYTRSEIVGDGKQTISSINLSAGIGIRL